MIDELIGTNIGPWEIERFLGVGGMGRVYRASREGGFPSTAAIKLMRPDKITEFYRRDLLQEAQHWMTVEHPFVARLLGAGIYSGGTLDGQPYLVMEFIEGVPLDRFADQRGLTIAARLQLFAKVCEGVQYLHDSGLAHLDLKPANIMVKADGTPKILDFGISRPLPKKDVKTSTFPHSFSTLYASPEQIQRTGEPTRAADSYSLGVILFELLTGHRPFPEVSPEAEQIRLVLETEPAKASQQVLLPRPHRDDRPPRTPEDLAKMRCMSSARELQAILRGPLDCILQFALRREPEHRYSTVQRLLDDIQHYLRGERIVARPEMAMYSALRLARRWPGWVVATALFLTMLQAHWTVGLMLEILDSPIKGQLQELSAALAEAEPILAAGIITPLANDSRTAELADRFKPELQRLRAIIKQSGDLK